MAAPIHLASWLCRRLFRSDFTCVLWILFAVSLVAVVTMYSRIMESPWTSNKEEFVVHEDFREGDFLDDEVEGLNLISNFISDSSHIGIEGWWMPHVKWLQDIDCDIGKFGVCREILSVICKPDSVRAIYQYISLKNDMRFNRLLFSAKSAAVDMKIFEDMEGDAMYSALALLKYDNGRTQTVKLDFPRGTHSYLEAEYELKIPKGRRIHSVVVMLGCYGYTGSIKFLGITLRPVLPESLIEKELIRSDFVAECPVPSETEYTQPRPFVTEQIFEGPEIQDEDDITLVTQVSMDRIDMLEKSIEFWDGPMSIVLYVPTKSETLDTDHEWKRYYITKKLQNPKFKSKSVVRAVYANTLSDEYPINYLRNLAIKQSQTKYILLLDADFIPSPGFREKFLTEMREGIGMNNAGYMAFIVPAFEFIEGLQEVPSIPQTKEELRNHIHGHSSNILPFRFVDSPEAHRATDYNKWYTAMQPYMVTNYQDKFEPYVVLKKTPKMPLYDERFTGYGMNKVTHIMELMAARYEMYVLPDVWAIHIPHRSTSYTTQFLQDPMKRLENRAARFEFVADIMNKYEIGSCEPER